MNEVLIYKTQDNRTEAEVQFDGETVWLNQMQMAALFNQTKQNISLHIRNCFKEKELSKKATVKQSLTVQTEGKRKVTRRIEYYNLDVIISIGYRVKSRQGTQFRQWATQRLKDYLIRGYAINQQRLDQLQQTIQLISSGSKTYDLHLNDAKGLLDIIASYTESFVMLNRFDSHNLQSVSLTEKITYEITYDEAIAAITELKKQLIARNEATQLFGKEKDNGFKSSLQSIVQTFDGHYLYPSIEEQAAHLLYFVIKNHSFTDGNALLVAQSKPEEKELMIQLIVNLTADNSSIDTAK